MMSETIRLVMVKRNQTGKDLAVAAKIYTPFSKKIIGVRSSFVR